jgi:hypothetical protein
MLRGVGRAQVTSRWPGCVALVVTLAGTGMAALAGGSGAVVCTVLAATATAAVAGEAAAATATATVAAAATATVAAAATATATAHPAAATEVHGSLDAYGGHGVALAWAVSRSGAPEDAEVVVRIEADARLRAVAVAGVDPFTRAAKVLLPPTRLTGPLEVRLPRAGFADLPRTEWRFFGAAAPAASDAPLLLIYYQGVPDTVPEFDDAARLAAYLTARVAAVRAGKTK